MFFGIYKCRVIKNLKLFLGLFSLNSSSLVLAENFSFQACCPFNVHLKETIEHLHNP